MGTDVRSNDAANFGVFPSFREGGDYLFFRVEVVEEDVEVLGECGPGIVGEDDGRADVEDGRFGGNGTHDGSDFSQGSRICLSCFSLFFPGSQEGYS